MFTYKSEKSEKVLSRKIRTGLANFIYLFLVFGLSATVSTAQTNAVADKPRETTVTPEQLSASFAEVARRVEPAVVNIDTKGKVPEVTLKNDKPTTEDSDDIMEFFRRQLPRRPSYAVGSGFIVDKSGYILTNYHVIEDASRISVRLPSGEEYVAKVIGADEETDLAVLKIEAGKDLPFIELGNSDISQVGDWVLAIGSPFGLAQSVTAGIISQIKRETPYASVFQKFIQTDAAINRGNSGGPLVNMNGEVIGINSQIATSTGDYNGIGFALPSNEAASVYRQILQIGKVRRGYLGVNLESVKAEYAKVYGLPEAKGAIITNISDKQSAAATAGLQVGDIILEFNGAKIASAADLIQKVSSSEPEKQVSVVFYRENGNRTERKTTLIKLAERPSNNKILDDEKPTKLSIDGQKKPTEPLGLTLTELTPSLAAVYKLEGEKGVLVKNINPASFIADVKNSNGSDALNEGDLIQRINRTSITNVQSFNEAAGKLKTGDAVVLQILSFNRQTRSPQLRIVQFTIQ
ncbi:MAG: Do family serine endopeptidase [Acidobacteriota bacterium]|nr:Do family serine endopeptidase [Acidobacteriota bacterium]